jgi:hypothetical protein
MIPEKQSATESSPVIFLIQTMNKEKKTLIILLELFDHTYQRLEQIWCHYLLVISTLRLEPGRAMNAINALRKLWDRMATTIQMILERYFYLNGP